MAVQDNGATHEGGCIGLRGDLSELRPMANLVVWAFDHQAQALARQAHQTLLALREVRCASFSIPCWLSCAMPPPTSLPPSPPRFPSVPGSDPPRPLPGFLIEAMAAMDRDQAFTCNACNTLALQHSSFSDGLTLDFYHILCINWSLLPCAMWKTSKALRS